MVATSQGSNDAQPRVFVRESASAEDNRVAHARLSDQYRHIADACRRRAQPGALRLSTPVTNSIRHPHHPDPQTRMSTWGRPSMSYQPYGSAPPELSNNPFIDHPSNALNRFPDINGTDSPSGTTSQFTSWLQPGGGSSYAGSNNSGGYGAAAQPQQQQQAYGAQGYQAQQQSGWSGNGGGYPQQQGYNSGYTSPVQTQPTGRPFQPSTSFGQQLQGQVAAAYGQQAVSPQPQQQVAQYATGYPQQQQQQYGAAYGYGQQQLQPQQTAYAPEFDPYGPQAQYQQQQAQAQPPPSQTQTQTSTTSTNSGYRPPHPREFIQQNKAEMEAWDSYAWKQVSHRGLEMDTARLTLLRAPNRL